MKYLVDNRKWPEDRLWQVTKEVISRWPTGAQVDLQESVQYMKGLPRHKVYAERCRDARRKGEPLLEPQAGRAITQESIDQVNAIEEGGGDLVYFFTDAYTRKGNYIAAEKSLEESRKQGRSLLNGYPVVCAGAREARRIVAETNIPVRLWDGSDEAPELQVVTGLAAGFTAHGAHDLHDLFQHSKDFSLEKRIEKNQYVCRLMGWYQEQGVPINIQIPGNLCGYDCPDIKISLDILQALTAAGQGIKSITPAVIGVLHVVQDMAAVRVLRRLSREYLDRFGYKDVELFVQHGAWQGNWPMDKDRGAALVALDVVKAVFAGADIIRLRCTTEGRGIPTCDDLKTTCRLARQMANMLKFQPGPVFSELDIEERMLELSVRAIVDKTLELGDGDHVVGEIEANKVGVLDASFTGWKHAYGKVTPVRDATGAMRWFDCGNLPLPPEVKEYHRSKLAQRQERLKKPVDLDVVIQDLFSVSIDDVRQVSLG